MSVPFLFIFNPGCWLGKGKIAIQGAAGTLDFYTRWVVSQGKGEAFSAVQTVEMVGVEEHVTTSYVFTDITETTFAVFLDNKSIGQVVGKGVFSASSVAWEFHSPLLEGYESYDLLNDDTYVMRAEYSSTHQYRTRIEGTLWRKC